MSAMICADGRRPTTRCIAGRSADFNVPQWTRNHHAGRKAFHPNEQQPIAQVVSAHPGGVISTDFVLKPMVGSDAEGDGQSDGDVDLAWRPHYHIWALITIILSRAGKTPRRQQSSSQPVSP
jgi:hypothetical protein